MTDLVFSTHIMLEFCACTEMCNPLFLSTFVLKKTSFLLC